MRIPVIHGVIERRVLVNYRVDPRALAAILPPPFQPKVIHGHAIAGVCLIRLRDIRPRWLPALVGLSSENAAHRIAVQWNDHGQTREGVYIPRRDTSSRVNTLVGGRLFPGEHHRARFEVDQVGDRLAIAVASHDGQVHVNVRGTITDALPAGSVFADLAEASAFFEAGGVGYSATSDARRLEGLELRCKSWRVEPLAVEGVRSSFFENPALFPPGSCRFDCALVMRQVEHEWHSLDEMCCAGAIST